MCALLEIINLELSSLVQLDEDITEKMAEEEEYRKIRVRMRAEVSLELRLISIT